MSRVDVIVPCYRYAHYLRACVGSVLRQEGVGVRVLILDDASPDDTPAVGTALAAEDSRVEYRRHAVNQGHIRTYNEGIDWLSGDYCLLLSADDMVVPGALARAATVLDRHPEVGLTHGRAVWTPHPESASDRLVITPAVTIQTGLEFIRSRCEVGQNYVETPTAIGRTAVQKVVGYYRPELPHSGDMEMWLRYAAHASVAELHAHQAYYRTHGANMSGRYRPVDDLRQIKLAFDAFFTHSGGQLPMSRELRQTAARAVGDNAFDAAYAAFRDGQNDLFAELIRFAREVDPSTRFAPKWLRLRLKQLLGPGVWNRLRPLRRWLGAAGRRLLPRSSPRACP